ncbi:MAG: hypothetical protein ACTSWN_00070, partial [Promethearchaeota archaeon]
DMKQVMVRREQKQPPFNYRALLDEIEKKKEAISKLNKLDYDLRKIDETRLGDLYEIIASVIYLWNHFPNRYKEENDGEIDLNKVFNNLIALKPDLGDVINTNKDKIINIIRKYSLT